MGYLICEKCKGYYELQPGEHPEDFDKCQCGGQLKYKLKHKINRDPSTNSQNISSLPNFHMPLRLLGPLAFFLIVLVISYTNFLNSGLNMPYIVLLFIAVSMAISFIFAQNNRNTMHKPRNPGNYRYPPYHRYPKNSRDSGDSWDLGSFGDSGGDGD